MNCFNNSPIIRDFWEVRDPVTGCSIRLAHYLSGMWRIQYDKFPYVNTMTEEQTFRMLQITEKKDVEKAVYELLKTHAQAHSVDMSYAEMAAR